MMIMMIMATTVCLWQVQRQPSAPPRLDAAIVITTAARFHMATRSGHQLACLSVCLVALSVSGSAVLLTPHSVAARMSKSNEEHEIAAAAAAPRYMSTST